VKYQVGAISRRFRTVSSIAPGSGLPPSRYIVPPLCSTSPTSWLPPAVWCHGAQSTITGGSSVKYWRAEAIIAWFAHHMRWVLITPFGMPVEPEVNRNFAIVSGVTRACAASAA
jgi:hypothetical protein